MTAPAITDEFLSGLGLTVLKRKARTVQVQAPNGAICWFRLSGGLGSLDARNTVLGKMAWFGKSNRRVER